MRRLVPVLAMALLAGCGPRPAADPSAARAELDSALARIGPFYAAGQADSLASLYLPDGTILVPNAKPIVGRDSIAARLRRMLSGGVWSVRLESQEVLVEGPMAVTRGRYGIMLTVDGTEPFQDRGHFVIVWRRTPEGWRVQYDVSASELPRRPTSR